MKVEDTMKAHWLWSQFEKLPDIIKCPGRTVWDMIALLFHRLCCHNLTLSEQENHIGETEPASLIPNHCVLPRVINVRPCNIFILNICYVVEMSTCSHDIYIWKCTIVFAIPTAWYVYIAPSIVFLQVEYNTTPDVPCVAIDCDLWHLDPLLYIRHDV